LLRVAASSSITAFLCGSLRSPIFRPARGTIVVGRFDHLIRWAASLNSNSTFDRCPSSSELRKPFALATILEATLKELWADASPQHRTAARKLLLLGPRRVVFTIGDLLNKGKAMLSRPDDGESGSWAGHLVRRVQFPDGRPHVHRSESKHYGVYHEQSAW